MTAKLLGVTLFGGLQPCTVCSMGKDLWKAVRPTTTKRVKKEMQRVFVDLNWKKGVEMASGSQYCVVVRNDLTRSTWLYFLKHKSDASKARISEGMFATTGS